MLLFFSPIFICLCIFLAVLSQNNLGDLFGLCVMIAGDIFLLYLAWRARNDQIVICSDGLLYVAWDKNDAAVRCDEIEQVQISTHYLTYTIVRNDHTTFDFRAGPGAWTRSKVLRAVVEREVTQHLLPNVITQFNQRKTIFFGGLSIGREGISGWRETIPWSEIEDIEMRKGDIVILKTGSQPPQHLTFSSAIPNPFVAIALIKYILNSHQPIPVLVQE